MNNHKPLSTNDDAWFESFKSGNAEAYKSVFDLFYRPIAYYATKILQDPMDAEEIAVHSFLKAWEHRSKIESPKHLQNFLYLVTRNASISFRRAERKRRSVEQELFMSLHQNDDSNGIDLERLQTGLIQRIYELLEKMPNGKVVKMAYLEGKSTAEIADELKTTENNVYIMKSRTLQQLRDRLGKDTFLIGLIICLTAANTESCLTFQKAGSARQGPPSILYDLWALSDGGACT